MKMFYKDFYLIRKLSGSIFFYLTVFKVKDETFRCLDINDNANFSNPPNHEEVYGMSRRRYFYRNVPRSPRFKMASEHKSAPMALDTWSRDMTDTFYTRLNVGVNLS